MKRISRGIVSALICITLLTVAGVVIFMVVGVEISIVMKMPSPETTANTDSLLTARAPKVSIRVIENQLIEDRLLLTGSVQPWEEVTLSSEIRGKIEWKGVKQGGTVKTGQELYRIDTQSLRARLAQAQAQKKLAAQELERNRKLSRKGAGTAQSLDSAIANDEVAASNLRTVEIEVAKSIVKAPFDAVVDHTLKNQDEFVDAGAPLLRLVQVHKVKVFLGVPESDAAYFKAGDKVDITLDSLKGRAFEGMIYHIATTADMATHTFTAEVELDNSEGLLKPGMIARGKFIRKTYPESIMIPLFASILLDDERIAFIEKDGAAMPRVITTGLVQGDSVQVVSGLKPGDNLIVKGQYEVRPGQNIEVEKRIE